MGFLPAVIVNTLVDYFSLSLYSLIGLNGPSNLFALYSLLWGSGLGFLTLFTKYSYSLSEASEKLRYASSSGFIGLTNKSRTSGSDVYWPIAWELNLFFGKDLTLPPFK